jgi:cytochrome c-type protein NapB
MKLIARIGLSVVTVSTLFLTACNSQPAQSAASNAISDTELSYRNVPLEGDATTPELKYVDNAPGSGKKFKRAFQDAPPMIPHTVDGMLPIMRNNNACLGCHLPNVAKSVGATAIPPSHFTNFRPDTKVAKDGSVVKDGKVVANTSDVKVAKFKKLNHLYQGRFNCTQCHAPQADTKPLVANKFQADFKKGGEFKSNLNDDILEGIE